ncbi:MAG: hypothetical protein ABUK20_09165 [Anaerolineales bacterium]
MAKKIQKTYIIAGIMILILATTACGTFQVGVEAPAPVQDTELISENQEPELEFTALGEAESQTEDEPAPEPAEEIPESPITIAVIAWLGHIASLPEGSQYDDFVILSPQGTGEFGLTGATQEIEAEIRTLRDADGPSEYVHLWGMLSCDVEDYNGCQIAVDRLQNGYRNGAQYSEGEVVDGWMGTITASTFNMGTAYVFELLGTFPMWYGIDASQDESLQAQIESLRDTGAVVKVSGKLMVGIPDVNGTRIEVSELDVIEAGTEEQPALEDTFDPTADWPVFINDRYGYQIKTPREATITLYGPMGFMPDDVPDGMTGDQYMDQLQKTLTDRLCVYIEYSLGFIYISAPPNQEKLYVHCGIPAPGAGDHIAKIEMVGIGDQLYQANGMEWISGGPSPSGETLDLHSETFWIDLDDGTRIAYGATYRTDATYEDYLMKTKEMLLQILATFEAMP